MQCKIREALSPNDVYVLRGITVKVVNHILLTERVLKKAGRVGEEASPLNQYYLVVSTATMIVNKRGQGNRGRRGKV